MISCIVIMLLFSHFQKLSQLDPGVKISYDILTPPLSLDILTLSQFYTTKSYSSSTQGSKYGIIILTPPDIWIPPPPPPPQIN